MKREEWTFSITLEIPQYPSESLEFSKPSTFEFVSDYEQIILYSLFDYCEVLKRFDL